MRNILVLWLLSNFYHIHASVNKLSSNSFLNKSFQSISRRLTCLITSLTIASSFCVPSSFGSLSHDIDDSSYKNVFFNIPSDDFWYPPFMIGKWKTDLKFKGVSFTNKITIDKLIEQGDLPGIKKYSIGFLTDIGSDLHDVVRKYVQLDSHPREDHPFNIRQLMQLSSSDTIVDSAPYYFQKAPDWFHSPSNHWNIQYHDKEGKGILKLLTKKREIEVFAGSVETFELFHQEHERINNINNIDNTNSNNKLVSKSDYAINWKLAVPESARDEFITVQDLSKTTSIVGYLNILAYLQPGNILYNEVPTSPAAVYTYQVSMTRMDDGTNYMKDSQYKKIVTKDSISRNKNKKVLTPSVSSTDGIIGSTNGNPVYPFVWRYDGPIDSLQDYFGY